MLKYVIMYWGIIYHSTFDYVLGGGGGGTGMTLYYHCIGDVKTGNVLRGTWISLIMY